MADKLHDFLMNPKSRPDLQTPKGRMFLKVLADRFHNEKTDALMPWLAKEWKRGRLGEGSSGSWLEDALSDHPVGRALPDETKEALRTYDAGKAPAQAPALPDDWDLPVFHDHLIRNTTSYPFLYYTAPHGLTTPLRPENLAHWGDFLGSNHPLRREMGDIMRHDITSFNQRIHDWDAAMKEEATERALQGGEVYHTTPDGWTVRRLRTPEELKGEGDVMGHCVGTYHPAVNSGDTQIYSLRDPEHRPHATVEIRPNRTAHGNWLGPNQGKIVQIQGKNNEQPKPEYQAKLKDWFTNFPEEQRPNWSDRPSRIDHIGGIMPEAESYDSGTDEMVRGEPDEDGYGGYGPHGDYGLVQPERPIDYPSVVDSLIRPKSYNEWHSQNRGTDTYPMDFDQKEVEALYKEALRRGEVPELAEAIEKYGEQAMNEFDQLEESQMMNDPDYMYPGESWDEEPERWQEIVNRHLNDEYHWGHPYHGVETPQEAFDRARRYYDDTQAELYDNHLPSQLHSALNAKVAPHWHPQGWADTGEGPKSSGYYNPIYDPKMGTLNPQQLQDYLNPPPATPPPSPDTVSKVAAASNIPPGPGTTPIPQGHIRLYHYTGATPEQIAQEGLNVQYAKGSTYGEPDMIWASGNVPSLDNHNVVEFAVPRDDPRWDIGKYDPMINYAYREGGDSRTDPAFDYGKYLADHGSHVTFRDSIRPDEVVAVHEPWHQHYRYLMDRYPTPDASHLAEMGGPTAFDWAINDDPEGLGRAVQEWKNVLWPQGTTSKVASTPLYKRWVFSPATGEVTLADNSDHPLQVRYHQDLANRLNEPGLVHGYAYRIGNGWRLTDWESQPVSDPFVIAQVMRRLQATEGHSGAHTASWEPFGTDWSRCHYGLPDMSQIPI